jgi:hypothetical protein
MEVATFPFAPRMILILGLQATAVKGLRFAPMNALANARP